ncbi:ABC transporter permease [Xylanimonas allomyrinae]|uniref:Transport permease protein n=2 Tax=Xylanimonas allomyrinae TaxID=2509459 RepID=A0A4P6ES87_9MICO|nr:ABC transporter permease [Xylanimonas allomyrinae]
MVDPRDVRASALASEPLRPAGPRPGFVGGTVQSVKDIWTHRELLGLLTRREIKARYKDSALGLVWSLLKPIALLCVYWLAIGKFLEADRSIDDFSVYIFAGLTAWQLFSDIILAGTSSIVGNSGLIKKVYVPREVFPLSSIGSALFNFSLQLIILIGFTVIRGAFPTGTRWLYAALGLAVLVTWATTLVLVLSAVNVYLRDVQYLVEIALMLFMWVSPIVYAWSMVADRVPHWLAEVYLSNPMTQVVLSFQRTFWVRGDGSPMPTHLAARMGVTLVVSLVLLWVAQRTFARLQSNFAQEL